MQTKKTGKASGGQNLDLGSRFRFVPIDRLKTNYAAFRCSKSHSGDESPLPLRVVPGGDDYEVIDGFKRLEAWRIAGCSEIPVVIEHGGTPADHKKHLLLSNSPRRTVSALDEACIAHSLRNDEGMSMAGIAAFLGHRKTWVVQRIALVEKLSPKAQAALGQEKIGPPALFASSGSGMRTRMPCWSAWSGIPCVMPSAWH